MIDWKKVSPDDFKLQLEVESIQESGDSIIFPVRVYRNDGEFAFLKSVPVRGEFYRALKQTPDWQKLLTKIFRQRVRDDIIARSKEERVSIEDKISWITD